MAKGFCIGGSDFDTLFEAPYTNFNTVTFSNLSPTCKYCTRYFGDNPNSKYSNNGTLFDASPRGFLPSNYKVATVTTTGRWMKIQRESTGFSVNGTTYRNSNRGSYPINRVSVAFCGGGGGGGGGEGFVSEEGNGYYANWICGSGGGGGATVAVTLWLDKYTYYLYLGAGGSGGSSGGSSGSNGGASYLRLTSSSGTLLATANGGSRDSGQEATATINNGNYSTTIGTAKGGTGASGGSCGDMYWDRDMDYGYIDDVWPPFDYGGSGTISGYTSQQVSGAKLQLVTNGGSSEGKYTWYAPDGGQYDMGPGGGGRSALGTKGGAGGDAGYEDNGWGSASSYQYDGDAGEGGMAFFYY